MNLLMTWSNKNMENLGFLTFSDLVVIIIIVFFVVLGLKSGFMRMLLRFTTSLISFVISLFVYPALSAFVKSTEILNLLANRIQPLIRLHIDKVYDNATSGTVSGVLEKMGYVGFIRNWIMNSISNTKTVLNFDVVAEKISVGAAGIIIDIFSLILLYIVVKIVLFLLKTVLLGAVELPVIKQLDKALGGVLGFINGILTAYVLAALVLLVNYSTPNEVLDKDIQTSFAAKPFYTKNFIAEFIIPDKVLED